MASKTTARRGGGIACLVVGAIAWIAAAGPVAAQDYSGEWQTNAIGYDCPAVHMFFHDMQVLHSGTSLTIVPDGPDPGPLTGSIDANGHFVVHAESGGPCQVEYLMEGTFSGPARMQAALHFTFDFTCIGCTDQHRLVDAWRVWAVWGHALAGTHGEPSASGTGSLGPGSTIKLTMTGALENWPVTLVAGASQLAAPFKGGVMFPQPGLLVFLPGTGPTGSVSLQALWPSGVPSGVTVYFQWWFADPAGPAGFAASNGVSATTP